MKKSGVVLPLILGITCLSGCKVRLFHFHHFSKLEFDDEQHWKKCDCGEEIRRQHDLTKWEVTVPADEENDGEEYRHCKTCEYQEKRTINALGSRDKLTFTFVENGNDPYYEVSCKDIDIEGKVVIPYYYENIPVKVIPDEGFDCCYKVTEFVINAPIETIGDAAFRSCLSIESFELPKTLISLGTNVFEHCSSLIWAGFPECLAAVPDYTFYNCKSLFSVSFSADVQNLGNNCFAYCSSLDNFILPETVKTIGKSAFFACNGLKYLTLSRGLEEIQSDAFSSCSIYSVVNKSNLNLIVGVNPSACGNLTSVAKEIVNDDIERTYKISNDFITHTSGTEVELVKYIGTNSYVEIPSGVTKILPNAFQNSTVYKLTISNSVKDIGKSAFLSSKQLHEVIFEEGTSLEVIPESCFNNCVNLNVFEIPSTVTTISARAFYDCSRLYRIVLPSGLTNIGDDAFGNCYRLVEVVNKSTLPIVVGSSDYGGVGFYAIQIRTTNINGIQDDGSYVYYMDPNTYRDILIDCRVTDAVIPNFVNEILSFAFVNRDVETVDLNNVNKINYRSFDNNHTLYQVTTGENLTTIAENSFYNCDALSEIINKTSFDDNTLKEKCSSTGTYIRGVIKNKSDSKIKIYGDSITYNNGTDIIMVASQRYALDIKIADEVTQMSANIFKENKNITSVIFGNNIKTIPSNAFRGCEALKEVILSDSVETIGENAFQSCYNLEKVKFGSGIKNIYSGAFKSNAALKEVKIESEVDTYSGAFESCTNLVNVYLPNGTVGQSVFRYCSNLKKIVVKDGTQSVAPYAFNGCSHLSDVSFSVMKTLSISAFDGCESLKRINLSQATNLPGYTFRNCKKLVISDGVINNAITTIGDSAFAYCESIDKVFIENGGNLKTIEANAFLCCYALKDLTIGNKVETIGNLAFSTCTSLETITLPQSLRTIGNRVFRSCENLKEIIFTGSTYEWDTVSKGSEWLTGTQVTQIKCSNGNIDLA